MDLTEKRITKEELDLIISLRRELHNCPEPSLQETKTKMLLMNFIREHTTKLQLVDRGDWFYCLKRGADSGEAVAFRADYDAVLCGDGVPRHLCGHDGHSAVLAGFALLLDRMQTDRDCYLIFQPAEEIGMGAKLCASLIKEGKIGEIYGFHNIPGYDCGEVLLRTHTFACASTGLEIKLTGKQSHAAYPDQGNNPAGAIAEIIQKMHALVAENHKGIVLGTVIGIDLGGDSYGVSAGEGTLRLTLRAEYQDEYEAFVSGMETFSRTLVADAGLQCSITRIEEFPATTNDSSCVEKVKKAVEGLHLEALYPEEPLRWSEDFGHYLMLTRGAYFGVGCGRNHPALHTVEYEFEDSIMETVIRVYSELL
ncbi:MAG: M20/M25/M40 family metallo-hydrolase [Lachnospiraceae bacterium]|nr:M20/M25/M40 family metallo-hydrolase [Lachnospiraceae bacterium]